MKIFLLLPILCLTLVSGAQSLTYSTVKIEFEKTIAFHAYLKDINESVYKQIKDRVPETVIKYYDFIGDSSHSLYQIGRSTAEDPGVNSWLIGDEKVVYNNYQKKRITAQKTAYEQVFLMEDVMSKIKWKLTSDMRTIAGFDCRKAIGILDDSVAVFAFYTDDLMICGGPEGIQGLPGMILGMGVPRLHATWFATKVEVNGVNLGTVRPPAKGKKTNRAMMMKELDGLFRQSGRSGGEKQIVGYEI
jgi:GLPGLI family protein